MESRMKMVGMGVVMRPLCRGTGMGLVEVCKGSQAQRKSQRKEWWKGSSLKLPSFQASSSDGPPCSPLHLSSFNTHPTSIPSASLHSACFLSYLTLPSLPVTHPVM